MTEHSQNTIKQMFNTDALGSATSSGAATDGQYMSLQDASNQTGYSMGTLRRYIKARKLKYRKLGRSFNSKLEVWVTPDMLNDQPQSEGLDVDEEGEALLGDPDDDYTDESTDHSDRSDQSSTSTLNWLQKKLDEKDEILREKEAKIEKLMHDLASASYRNGYLESQKEESESKVLLLEDKTKEFESKVLLLEDKSREYESKMLLLEDKSKRDEEVNVEVHNVEPEKLEKKSGMGKFLGWFFGKGEKPQ